ncbi:hypothetical protein K435DRAFT_517685 [Dendrothele bispora CBS 962.96]|uniref:Uncharacterized protein n=1 Tax=Dendrothele bispora (strain CBS 962.96) TaxID=1314807 RepID=A0A4S8MAF5_DENBC|nr:hypothetical protein K435DRAFT_517685 [Dendrothele bispora CBS 962.96]
MDGVCGDERQREKDENEDDMLLTDDEVIRVRGFGSGHRPASTFSFSLPSPPSSPDVTVRSLSRSPTPIPMPDAVSLTDTAASLVDDGQTALSVSANVPLSEFSSGVSSPQLSALPLSKDTPPPVASSYSLSAPSSASLPALPLSSPSPSPISPHSEVQSTTPISDSSIFSAPSTSASSTSAPVSVSIPVLMSIDTVPSTLPSPVSPVVAQSSSLPTEFLPDPTMTVPPSPSTSTPEASNDLSRDCESIHDQNPLSPLFPATVLPLPEPVLDPDTSQDMESPPNPTSSPVIHPNLPQPELALAKRPRLELGRQYAYGGNRSGPLVYTMINGYVWSLTRVLSGVGSF